eukprot:TRINITY_DN11546_c0_g1_i1.p1 TRINITY_DN11546_c0_g1~~TRINITY_DN11546_c0_g1_i1.p1  ORF type:complete len:258 (+),score=49.68 TRINITY_DN11546_c0_g1_i1:135-908(+)
MDLPEGLSAEAMAALAMHFSEVEAAPSQEDAPAAERAPDDIAPEQNVRYSEKEYWDSRFEEEEHKEWLCSYEELEPVLTPALQSATASPRILLVGCGNSSLGPDLYASGWKDITCTDYSPTVISAMRNKYAESHPDVKWAEADMTNMAEFGDGSFDVVLDKAAMDAIMAAEGSPWEPDAQVIRLADLTCSAARRVLAPGGVFIQISFAQPHFRKKYLLRSLEEGASHAVGEPYGWDLQTVNIDSGLGYFMYVMRLSD